MGHNSVVLGHPKSIGISRVDGLSTGPPDLGCDIKDCPIALNKAIYRRLFNAFE